MKLKSYKNKYSKKTKKDFYHKKEDKIWIIKIVVFSFLISFLFSFATESLNDILSLIGSIVVLLFFLILGVLFDMIGVAVTVADKKTFNSMATKKVKRARACLRLITQASKVSSFCNDVIGDICGILSGSAGVTIALLVSNKFEFSLFYSTLLITSIISALTIGGKALGKSLAINKSNDILYKFAGFLCIFNKKLDK